MDKCCCFCGCKSIDRCMKMDRFERDGGVDSSWECIEFFICFYILLLT